MSLFLGCSQSQHLLDTWPVVQWSFLGRYPHMPLFWHFNGEADPGLRAKNSWERTSGWLWLSNMLLTWASAKFIDCAWRRVKERKKGRKITNLNILLYQTNLDYRCNHQSINSSKIGTKVSPCLIHEKYTITIQKQKKHYTVHKYIAEEKTKACTGMFYRLSCSLWT